MSEGKSRWDEIREIQAKSGIGYRILGGIVLVGVLVLLGKGNPSTRNDFDLNLLTEIIGVAITVLIVDTIYSFRDKKRREQELQERLIREVRSPDHGIAIDALHQLRDKDWLFGENGLLMGTNLSSVDWHKGELSSANLRAASLPYSDLKGASINKADFSCATLWFAKLDKIQCFVGAKFKCAKMNGASLTNTYLHFVDFSNANLQGADFSNSQLYSVSLRNADLRAAKLERAHLQDVSLRDAKMAGAIIEGNYYQGDITLPDGSKLKHESDFVRFTNVRPIRYVRQ